MCTPTPATQPTLSVSCSSRWEASITFSEGPGGELSTNSNLNASPAISTFTGSMADKGPPSSCSTPFCYCTSSTWMLDCSLKCQCMLQILLVQPEVLSMQQPGCALGSSVMLLPWLQKPGLTSWYVRPVPWPLLKSGLLKLTRR